MSVTQRKRRDWSIVIFILPLGVVMMMCVGQLAIRMAPTWSVGGDMNSSLDPEKIEQQNFQIIPPVSSDILTPVSWWDTFLTPMGDSGSGIIFPPFITFEPTSSPTPTVTSWDSPTPPTATPVVSGTSSPTATSTKKPKDDTSTTTLTNTATASNTPTATGTPVTPNATLTPAPTALGTNTPPDGAIGDIPDNYYVVLSVSIDVAATPDGNYDLAFYESFYDIDSIQLDWIIIGISSFFF